MKIEKKSSTNISPYRVKIASEPTEYSRVWKLPELVKNINVKRSATRASTIPPSGLDIAKGKNLHLLLPVWRQRPRTSSIKRGNSFIFTSPFNIGETPPPSGYRLGTERGRAPGVLLPLGAVSDRGNREQRCAWHVPGKIYICSSGFLSLIRKECRFFLFLCSRRLEEMKCSTSYIYNKGEMYESRFLNRESLNLRRFVGETSVAPVCRICLDFIILRWTCSCGRVGIIWKGGDTK